MIEPTLKLNQQSDPPESPKRSGIRRWVVLGIALAALFAGIVVAILFALPRPHTPADYMMAGGLATMVTLLAFFGVLLSTQFRGAEAFYKKRSK
jgi:ferric-dicitrate binding protein FerR (iron transport regulator)